MTKWTLLLIVIGLGALGMLNRDKISAYVKHKAADVAAGGGTPEMATPNPATDAIARARKIYPALAVANSPFNKKFVELYNAKKESDPAFLASDDWPIKLAQQTAEALGSTTASATTHSPTEMSSSSLNARPPGSSPGYVVPPAVQLPGLKGSALDQRPPEKHPH